MNSSTDIPVTITPEAAARIAELGMQRELDQMIDHARRVVPELAAIEVMRELSYDTDRESVSITIYSDRPFEPGEKTSSELDEWVVDTFGPRVLEHLCLLLSPGRPHAR